MLEATKPNTTTKAPAHARREITASDVAALLRYDAESKTLHWLSKPRGKQAADLRAGYNLVREGKVIGRAVTIQGVRYREHHVAHLLTHGAWPVSTHGRKPKAPIAAVAAPAPIVPADLPEISRAVVAAAAPQHRGWLAGLGLRRATA